MTTQNPLEEGHDLGDGETSDSSVELSRRQNDGTTRPHRRWNAASKEEGPACQACRKKKARCSRTQPCSQCAKNHAECIYDDAKNKPGLRVGAIENLTQRLTTLENMFMGQSMVWQQVWRHVESLGGGTSSVPSAAASQGSLQEAVSGLRMSLTAIGSNSSDDASLEPVATVFNPSRPTKRRRTTYDDSEDAVGTSAPWHQSGLPADDVVDSLVDIYFERIHPWIPMLHVANFRRDMTDPQRRRANASILRAITSLCVRFSDDPRLGNAEMRMQLSKRSREMVILQSMESFSVANLQALIICALDTLASGHGPSAWSIVGSMTRTTEQLQLGVELGDAPGSEATSNGIISRIAFLPPPTSWCEEEERRRVFWNIFLMDRFCSISTGWNLSLTSADACRRLPCEGSLWEAGQRLERPTPYFGLSNQGAGRNEPSGLQDVQPDTTQQPSSIGGFAYAIEATESLSLVTSFFLQQAVDMSSPQQVQLWLMRFKQLDLRLIQWKVFLPEQWREACAVNTDGNMDPNLTLAHITHNTAVVLLHQGIAFPSAAWQRSTTVRLPSQSSAETCMAAAVEVATIAENFLQNSRFLANHQFAFCLFVCGRMLLAHATFFQSSLLAAPFESLASSLEEIARRWSGEGTWSGLDGATSRSANLASKFASRLRRAKDMGVTTLDIRRAAYSEDIMDGDTSSQAAPFRGQMQNASSRLDNASVGPAGLTDPSLGHTSSISANTEDSPDSVSLAFPPLPRALQCFNSTQKSGGISAAASSAAPMMISGEGLYGYHDAALGAALPGGGGLSGQVDGNFEDMNAYLEETFLPDQRISMYSQQPPFQDS